MNLQLKLALRYLNGRKLRSFLTTLAIVFGVMIIFGLNGLIPAFMEGFRKNMLAATSQVDLVVTSQTRGSFPESIADTVRQSEDVAAAAGSLTRPVSLPASMSLENADGSLTTAFSLVGLDPETSSGVRADKLSEGRALQAGDRGVAIVTDVLTDKTGLRVGDRIEIPASTGSLELEIIGIITGRISPGADEIFVPLADAQEVFNAPGQINTVEAIFRPGSDLEATRASILASLGEGYKSGGNEVGGELVGALEMGEVLMTMFGVAALLMGGFIIFNTFRTLVTERRRDIGMLRALGASRATVIGAILMEGLVQGVVGTALGLFAGWLMVVSMMTVVRPVLEDKLRFPVGGPTFSAQNALIAIVLGVGVTLLAGLLPALSASHVTPLEALRPSLPVAEKSAGRRRGVAALALAVLGVLGLATGNVGLSGLGMLLIFIALLVAAPLLVSPVARVFGGLISLAYPQEGALAQGNLVRQPDRSSITAAAIMISLAIVLTMAGALSTIFNGMSTYLDRSLGSDFLIMPQSFVLGGGNVGSGAELLEDIRALDGISAATSLRQTTTQVNGTDIQMIAIDPALYPELAGLVFSAGDEQTVYQEMDKGQVLIVNGIYAAQSGIKLGDTLTVQTEQGPKPYRVGGIASDYLNVKLATAYISHRRLAEDFQETTDLLIMANRSPDASAETVQAGLTNLVKDYPAFQVYNTIEWAAEMRSLQESSYGMVYILLGLLAVPSLIALMNTLGINVLERTREIGMLRAVGATRGQVRRMIIGESLLLSALGTAMGIVVGLGMGYVLINAMNASGFVMPYHFPLASLLLTIAIGLVFGVLAAVIPARQAAHKDIVAALHYE